MRKRIQTLEAAVLRTRIFNFILLFGIGVAAFLAVSSLATVKVQSSTIASLTSEVATKDQEYKELKSTKDAKISELTDTMKKLSFAAVDMNSELNTLKEEYNTKMKRLQELEERAELYDKYDYVLFDNGTRTDITYQRIKDVQKYCTDVGLSEDAVAFALSLVATESHGIEKAENSESTAAGFGQLLYNTAKYVYEEEMGNGSGSYYYALALDGDKNLEMTVNYISYLAKQYNGNPRNIINAYRGTSGDTWYVNKVEQKLKESDLTLASLKLISTDTRASVN